MQNGMLQGGDACQWEAMCFGFLFEMFFQITCFLGLFQKMDM